MLKTVGEYEKLSDNVKNGRRMLQTVGKCLKLS